MRIPKAIIVAALFIAPPARAGIWIIALGWNYLSGPIIQPFQ